MKFRKFMELVPRVTVELSNRCNYAAQHGKCPTSRHTDVQITSLELFKDLLFSLSTITWGRDRTFAFHVYNEPTIDPRLYYLLRRVKYVLPGIKPFICTNGWYMDGNLAEELHGAGMDRMCISIYSKAEHDRLKPQVKDLPYVRLHMANLKDKMLNPGDGPDPSDYRQCYSPVCDLTIRAPGIVGLCCIDWAREVEFGDLRKDSLRTIIEREGGRMMLLWNQLKNRVRSLPVCRRCWRRRAVSLPE